MALPDLLPFHGEWHRYVDELYAVFVQEIVHGGLQFQGLPVKSQYRPPTDGKGFGFWHIVSNGPSEAERLPDLRRCERIRWVAWVIKNVESEPGISWWENKRGSNFHVVLWLEEEDFAVILAKRNGYFMLRSAYTVDAHRKKSFRREREEFRRA